MKHFILKYIKKIMSEFSIAITDIYNPLIPAFKFRNLHLNKLINAVCFSVIIHIIRLITLLGNFAFYWIIKI